MEFTGKKWLARLRTWLQEKKAPTSQARGSAHRTYLQSTLYSSTITHSLISTAIIKSLKPMRLRLRPRCEVRSVALQGSLWAAALWQTIMHNLKIRDGICTMLGRNVEYNLSGDISKSAKALVTSVRCRDNVVLFDEHVEIHALREKNVNKWM